MDSIIEIPFNDLDGDTTDLNELIDTQLNIETCEEDGEDLDVAILEKIIFADNERTYNQLNKRTAQQIIKACNKTESAPVSCVVVNCENCDEIFSETDFQLHACLYDEFHQLNTVPNIEETHLQELQRETIDIMKANQSILRDMTRDSKSKASGGIECSKCCRKFVHENGLYRHWDMHIGELLAESPSEDPNVLQPVALCVFCGEVFPSDEKAWNHLVSHHVHIDRGINHSRAPTQIEPNNQPMDVNNNNIENTEQEVLSSPAPPRKLPVNEFVRMIFLTKLFACEYCESTFANVKSMLFHASNHLPSSGFQCETCDLRDISLKDILLHRRDECLIFRDVHNPLKNFPRVFVCNVCDDEFRGLEQLLEHRHTTFHLFPRIDQRTNELSFLCERCLETFPFAPQLIDHFHEKHQKKPKNNEVAETSERIPKASTTRRGGSHQTSTRPRQYLCEVCGKSYTQSSHLWQHLRFHQGVKPFACTVEGCDRKFTIRPDLNDHIRKCHTGERPFLCTICGKRFLTGSVYYQHRLIHRGERRYGCDECGKRFYRADALKNHLRIHSGEKPHNCPECNKAFRQRGDRDKHLKARHPNAEASNSPKKKRVKSFGRGRVKNNTSLYRSKPEENIAE